MVNPYLDFLGLYGGGADDLVERCGGGGAPSVNLMEELLGSLIPPRSNMSLLGAGLSTSMPCGDSATECLREELADASDVDERILLLLVTNFMKPLMVTLCCTHSKTNTPGGFLPVGEQYIEDWGKLGFVVNFQGFLELILVGEFFQSSSLSFWVMNLKNTN